MRATTAKAANTTVKALYPLQTKPVRSLDGLFVGAGTGGSNVQPVIQQAGIGNARVCAPAYRAAGGGKGMMPMPTNVV